MPVVGRAGTCKKRQHKSRTLLHRVRYAAHADCNRATLRAPRQHMHDWDACAEQQDVDRKASPTPSTRCMQRVAAQQQGASAIEC